MNDDSPTPAWLERDPWDRLTDLTAARIALGRCGPALPTAEILRFGLAHARARDAVHAPADFASLDRAFRHSGFDTLAVDSRARDRLEYLQRPDLGRRLEADSARRLEAASSGGCDVVFVVADGLSARAIESNALELLCEVRSRLESAPWRIGPVVLARQARVALGDEVGACLGARLTVMLIGERPGLSSPDSLGIYITWAPQSGRLDSERNCISNVRAAGQPVGQAAIRLCWMLEQARRLGLTGIGLKDESDLATIAPAQTDAATLDYSA
jgi:ethanolamine ammonia-lyase small subunit